MGRDAADLTGRVFGYLTVFHRSGFYRHSGRKYNEARWLCQCKCGKVSTPRSSSLLSGQSRSCGCLKRDNMATFGPRLSQFKRKEGVCKRNVFYHYKLRAGRKKLVFDFTFEEFLDLATKPCAYCGRVNVNEKISPSKEVFRYNGLDRQDSSIGYTKDNVVPCCGWCNIAKFTLTSEEFILNCKLVASQNS